MKRVCFFAVLILLLSLCSCSALRDAWQPTSFFRSDTPPAEQILVSPVILLQQAAINDRGSVPVPPSDLPPEQPKQPQVQAKPKPQEKHSRDTIVMNFIGDVMLAAENGDDGFWSFNLFAYDTPKDYYFKKMLPLFSADDWTVANCENVFTDRENPIPTEKQGEYTYWYYSGTENAQIFSAGSIELVSLANNHALDYGYEGRDDTAKALTAAGCTPIPEQRSVILEKSGVRVGLFCVSMYSEYYLTPILEWLEENRDTCDFRIVYYHGGTERVHEPNAWRIRASRAMIDAGADLVLGNHPHVLQPIEHYNGKTIVYSLGNFLFGGSHTCENRTMVYTLTLKITDRKLTGTEEKITPCYCYGELWQPTPIEKEEDKSRVLAFLQGEREKPY